ncbi:MAG TPA: STAS domain-containing protein [Steroidobacteraceae bacterium]
MGAFSIERSSPERLVASGDLGFATATEALAAGVRLLDGGACTIDLAKVTDSDSAGLAVLIEWLAHARGKGCRLRYENVPSQILAIARISDVQDLLLPP